MGTRVYSQEDRIRKFGIECSDSVLWKGGSWEPNGEYFKTFVLKNVGGEIFTLSYKPTQTKVFSTDYPEQGPLCPGMQKRIEIIFRPVDNEMYEDKIEFTIKKKKTVAHFTIPVRALIPEVKIDLPDSLDFGFCAVNEISEQTFVAENTGQIPVHFNWDMAHPFIISPAEGSIEASTSTMFTIQCSPAEASVFVSRAILNVDGKPPREFKLSCVGKYPYLELSESKLMFGECLTGTSLEKEIILYNRSLVSVPFIATPLAEELRSVFSVFPMSAIIPAETSLPIRIRYMPSSTGQFSSESFAFSTNGGNTTTLHCTGIAVGPRVCIGAMDKATDLQNGTPVVFPETAICGKNTQYHARSVTLSNLSGCPAKYHFLTDPRGIFTFDDNYSGTIGKNSQKAITIHFKPESAGNYYQRVYCIIQDQSPLYFDLIGTAYIQSTTESKTRPRVLELRHVEKHKQRERTGLHLARVDKLIDLDSDEMDRKDNVTGSNLAEELFDTSYRYITTNMTEVDFGGGSRYRKAEPLTLKVKNVTENKLVCAWSISSETPSAFEVHPASMDVDPGKTVDFRVYFRPSEDNRYFSGSLTSHVYVKSNRNFKLVDDRAFLAPSFVSLPLLGHSFGPETEHFLPMTSIETHNGVSATSTNATSHHIEFPPCSVGGSEFQTICVNNTGTTPIKFEFAGNSSNLFTVTPRAGMIPPGKFHLLVFRCSPDSLGINSGSIQLHMNESSTINFDLVCFGDIPRIQVVDTAKQDVADQLFVRPANVGQIAKRTYLMVNEARIPATFEWKVPKRFQSMLKVEPASGVIRGKEEMEMQIVFDPKQVGQYDMQAVLLCSGKVSKETHHTFSVCSEGIDSILRMKEASINLPTVLPGESTVKRATLINNGDCDAAFSLTVDSDAEGFLTCEPQSGIIPARSSKAIDLCFKPTRNGTFTWSVSCDGNQSSGLEVRGCCTQPTMIVEDIRSSGVPTPQLWNQFNVNQFNTLLQSKVRTDEQDLADAARKHNDFSYPGLDQVEMHFTPDIIDAAEQTIIVQLKNTGGLPMEFAFILPFETDSEIEPWAKSQLPSETELKTRKFIEDKNIDISPRSGSLDIGEAACVKFSLKYSDMFSGDNSLDALLKIRNGKHLHIVLKGRTLEIMEPCVFPTSKEYVLSAVPLGTLYSPVQEIELQNRSNMDIHYGLDLDPIEQLNRENYDFTILECLNPQGTIKARESLMLRFRYLPLELKQYQCNLKVTYWRVGKDTHQLETIFSLIMPTSKSETNGAPQRQLLAMPQQVASISNDFVDFGTLVKGSRAYRLSIIRNLSANPIAFTWDATHPLLKTKTVEIYPVDGLIEPGSFAVCKFVYNAGMERIVRQSIICNIDTQRPDSPSFNDVGSGRALHSNRGSKANTNKPFQSVSEKSTHSWNKRVQNTMNPVYYDQLNESRNQMAAIEDMAEGDDSKSDVSDGFTPSSQNVYLTICATVYHPSESFVDSHDCFIVNRVANKRIDDGGVISKVNTSNKVYFTDFMSRYTDIPTPSKAKLRNDTISSVEFANISHRVLENTLFNLVQETLHGEIDISKVSTLLFKKGKEDIIPEETQSPEENES